MSNKTLMLFPLSTHSISRLLKLFLALTCLCYGISSSLAAQQEITEQTTASPPQTMQVTVTNEANKKGTAHWHLFMSAFCYARSIRGIHRVAVGSK